MKSRTTQRGYSLAEVMVAMAVFTIIVIAALTMYDQSNKVFKRGVEAADMQQNVRVAFEKMVGELRMAGYDFDRDGIPTGSAGFVWQANRVYSLGDLVTPAIANGFTYRLNAIIPAATTCTSGAMPGPTWTATAGATVSDGACRWLALTAVNQHQQPDEQIEYAGQTAIAIRGNFDYELDRANGNGRETALESAQFPVVTTGNDEIVIYALRSVNGPNADTLTFHADVTGRSAYPGGSQEDAITIPSLDLGTAVTTGAGCSTLYPCYRFNYPPYTLYRFTVNPAGTGVVETPLASNIRSMNLLYYTNVTGTTTTTEPSPYPDGWSSQTRLTDPGGGSYNPAAPDPSRIPRLARSLIKSVRLTLVGMGESLESNYDNPLEAAGSPADKYRTYRLESLIVPRNLGKQGVREIPPSPPGAPSIQSITYGMCGAVTLSWLAPSSSTSTGPVESYIIAYNTLNNGVFPFIADGGPSTTGTVSGLTPGQIYYFTVIATNSFGNQIALTAGGAVQVISATPQNRTNPGPPSGLSATGSIAPAIAARANEIVLGWTGPTTNASPHTQHVTQTIGGAITTAAGSPIADEIRTYKVYRSTIANFTPVDTGSAGANEVSTTAPNELTISGNTATFTDRTVLNCIRYYYRVRAIEHCGLSTCASCNVGGAVGISAPFPATGTNGMDGISTASSVPAAPASLIAAPGSECNGLNCSINLVWAKVRTDVASPPNDLRIEKYIVERTRYLNGAVDPDNAGPAGAALVRIEVTDSSPTSGTTMTLHDTPRAKNPGNEEYTYHYTVTAVQCPVDPAATPVVYTSTSAPSPVLWFPCDFSGSAVTVDVTLTLEGDGLTPASAWLTNNPASSVVVGGTGLVSAQAYLRTGTQIIDLGTDSAAPYEFPLIEAEVGEVYEMTVVVRDAAGCTQTLTRYIEEGTATGCCLAAFANDSTVVRWAVGQTFVDIAFKNLCSQQLDISSLQLQWNPVTAGNATATTLTNVEFPSTGTGSAVHTASDTAAAGATALRTINVPPPTSFSPPARITVDPESENYVIRVNFNKPLNTASPITSACVIYTRPGIDVSNQNCRIIPEPTTLFSCN